MLAGFGRIAAALAIAIISTAAIAQVIPPSAQPGRERERFTQPPVPRAQPGGPPVSLPSTVAPPGAEKVKVVIRSVRVVGSTVYSAAQLEPLYADLLGRRNHTGDGLRDCATHHRQVWRRWLCALARHCVTAAV